MNHLYSRRRANVSSSTFFFFFFFCRAIFKLLYGHIYSFLRDGSINKILMNELGNIHVESCLGTPALYLGPYIIAYIITFVRLFMRVA
jgi:hypothetical protein